MRGTALLYLGLVGLGVGGCDLVFGVDLPSTRVDGRVDADPATPDADPTIPDADPAAPDADTRKPSVAGTKLMISGPSGLTNVLECSPLFDGSSGAKRITFTAQLDTSPTPGVRLTFLADPITEDGAQWENAVALPALDSTGSTGPRIYEQFAEYIDVTFIDAASMSLKGVVRNTIGTWQEKPYPTNLEDADWTGAGGYHPRDNSVRFVVAELSNDSTHTVLKEYTAPSNDWIAGATMDYVGTPRDPYLSQTNARRLVFSNGGRLYTATRGKITVPFEEADLVSIAVTGDVQLTHPWVDDNASTYFYTATSESDPSIDGCYRYPPVTAP
ncbi:MAG: hypothetical protein R2939_01655 [Kofleriaceae bacterium]